MGLNCKVVQAAALENAAVGFVMFPVADIKAGCVNVERIRVLHRELPHSKQAGLGARLIAKLLLDLIPDLWKLFVTAQLLARDFGTDFFGCHAEAQVAPAAT